MNKVLFKVDDFLFDGWKTGKPYIDNWNKFWDIISLYPEVKINLGIVGRTVCKDCNKEINEVIKSALGTKVELFNHSYSHADTPATVADAWENQNKINEVFGIEPLVYGAPRNDLSLIEGKVGMVFFKRDIPINAYQELENVQPGSFIQMQNFLDKYQKEHEQTKVYQMHPTVWDDTDRVRFQGVLDFMVADKKEWIFASEY